MRKKSVVAVMVSIAVLGVSVFGAAPVHAGGFLMPRAQQQETEPAPEPVSKMPVFEYEAPAKMPAAEEPAREVKEKTWVWVLLGFAAAVFLLNLD